MKHIKSTRSITVTQKMTGYLIECDTCGEQYTDSTKKKIRSKANNYKSSQSEQSVCEQRGSFKVRPNTKTFS